MTTSATSSGLPQSIQTSSVSANGTTSARIDFSGVGFAPLFFGFSASTLLYGSWVYFASCKKDKLWLRYLVVYLFVVETVMTLYNGVIVCGITTNLSVAGRFRDSGVDPSEKMMSNNTIFTVLLSTPVQLFLAWRIRVMDAPRVTSILIAVLSFASFGGGIATALLVSRSDQVIQSSSRSSSSPPFIWLGSSALADLLITTCLVYTLHTKKTGIKATDDIVESIIKLTIETGMATFLCTIIEAALYASTLPEPLYLVPDMMISKLYANSMIATLNARSRHNATNHVARTRSTAPIMFHHSERLTEPSRGLDTTETQVYEMQASIQAGPSRLEEIRSQPALALQTQASLKAPYMPQGWVARLGLSFVEMACVPGREVPATPRMHTLEYVYRTRLPAREYHHSMSLSVQPLALQRTSLQFLARRAFYPCISPVIDSSSRIRCSFDYPSSAPHSIGKHQLVAPFPTLFPGTTTSRSLGALKPGSRSAEFQCTYHSHRRLYVLIYLLPSVPMPSQTYREQMRSVFLAHLVITSLIYAPTPSPGQSELDSLSEQLFFNLTMLKSINETRYLHSRSRVPKSSQIGLLWEYAADPIHHHRFHDILGVSPFVFDIIHELIKDHPIFSNDSQNPQEPVDIQLAVTLYRLRHYGNAASVPAVARWAGCGEGTVEIYTDRCFDAIEDLHDVFVRTLTPEEKEQEKIWVEQQCGFRGSLWREGWLMYDGTIVVLYRRPGNFCMK
ncbi:hypothetical protein ONZ45_g18314 [Pleurotus djamor]|nr:hypothetical protein ONZ45_g18314 [Pleurotus djamor]